jgi:hypothetical protein
MYALSILERGDHRVHKLLVNRILAVLVSRKPDASVRSFDIASALGNNFPTPSDRRLFLSDFDCLFKLYSSNQLIEMQPSLSALVIESDDQHTLTVASNCVFAFAFLGSSWTAFLKSAMACWGFNIDK